MISTGLIGRFWGVTVPPHPLIPPPNVGDFKLSITRALADQLATSIERLTPQPLTEVALSGLEGRPGVYQLYLSGDLVYVGKASRDLPRRLRKHLRKLSGRTNISLDDVGFICLYVDEDLEASAPEKMLIARYRSAGDVPWNTNGFGNNDPGKQRDRSLVKTNHFDALYPINLEVEILLAPHTAKYSTDDYLRRLKEKLPFNLRYENKDADAVQTLRETSVCDPGGPRSVRSHLQSAFAALPSGWQLTILPGYVILYPALTSLDSAMEWWRNEPNGDLVVTAGPNRRAAAGVVEEAGTHTLE